MINQLPIINMLIFLATALIIPLLSKRTFKITLIFGFIMLLCVVTSSFFLIFHIAEHGAILYQFGGHDSKIGIEFKVDLMAAIIGLFVVGLTTIIYIYSCGDETEGVEQKEYGRYYILLFIILFAILGIIYTNDLFNAYVFMEIISITTCSIISIKRKKETYAASFRYVMLNEIGSLSYLFGVALIYMVTGYTNIDWVSQSIQSIWQLYSINIIIALGFMIVGIGIKAAIFPFHIWLPDAHASAPSSSSAILSSIIVKVYIVVLIKLLFKVFKLDILNHFHVSTILVIVAATGMIMGSIFAIAQKDIKRMLGYSSISQIGYIVMGIAMFSSLGLASAMFHIISHGLMKAALFLSVGIVIYKKKIKKKNDFEGLAYEMPITMSVFTIAALGMIGIPLTSGFMSKLTLGMASLDHRQGYLIIIVVLSGLLNVIYYLPIIISSFLKSEPNTYHPFKIEKVPWPMLTSVILLGIGILTFGIFPNLIMNMITQAAELFGLI